MKRKASLNTKAPIAGIESTDVKALQAEIARLKKELAHESLCADAFNESINVAEKQFNIFIRKLLAPSSKEPACSRLSESLCKLFGVTKQAYYKYDENRLLERIASEDFAVSYIKEIRKKDPQVREEERWHHRHGQGLQ